MTGKMKGSRNKITKWLIKEEIRNNDKRMKHMSNKKNS